MIRISTSRARRLLGVFLPLAYLVACDSTTEPEEQPGEEVGVVVNSGDNSLTIFRVDDPSVRSTVGLGADGSPVTIAVRGPDAVVPLGIVPAVAIVDVAARTVRRRVPLPPNSGATGVAFVNDSIALVGNSNLNTVSPVNVRTGERGTDIAVGRFPQALLGVGDTVYVLNGELGPDFQPAGPGTISVIAGTPLQVIRTVTLRGRNPGAAAVGSGGRIFVVNSGRFNQNEGSLSVIDRATLTEVAHHTGFRSFPGSVVVQGTRVHVGGFGIGVLVWDAGTSTFVRGPTDPIAPGGTASVSGLGVDANGRIYALKPECRTPSSGYRLNATFGVELEIPVGICPVSVVFTRVETPGA